LSELLSKIALQGALAVLLFNLGHTFEGNCVLSGGPKQHSVARLWNGSIPNTEVYNLMTEILHFTRPAANNGSGALALAVLKESTRLRPK
jgi:hypothetical protein